MPLIPRTLLAACAALAASPALPNSHKPPPPRPGQVADVHESVLNTPGAAEVVGEVWVDNWFALWVNGSKLIEDSVPITTERSFNAERFTFRADLPATFAFEFRDFMENATGLEYIGTRKQQMGDGGAIAQITVDGQMALTTGADWRCLVVQHAPVASSCEKARTPAVGSGDCAQQVTAAPQGWTEPGFDDSAWPNAVVHAARAVGPKDGYDRINWDRAAQIIWGPDLEKDNILLCRATLSQ